jgi:hypothetical protein
MIKVITGMRRVGKSYLLRQIVEEIVAGGRAPGRVVYVDKEKYEFDSIRSYHDLMSYVQTRCPDDGTPRCICVDEVQEIVSWEKAVASLASDPRTDVYIAGSNSQLLSSELAGKLSGRYVECHVFPLCFSEFLEFRASAAGSPREEFLLYARYGGMPAIHDLEFVDETIYQYLGSLHNTILLEDIIERHAVRNALQLESIVRFLYDGVGTTVSAKRVSDYLRHQHVPVNPETVQSYIGFLVSAYAIHQARRFDLRGKRHLETLEKYYLGDIGLRHGTLGFREGSLACVLENIVYQELRVRGFTVSVGKIGDREIDFVAEKQGNRSYVQVAYMLYPESTVEREFRVLQQLDDNYPKFVISLDEAWGRDVKGITRLNLVDFLLDRSVLC